MRRNPTDAERKLWAALRDNRFAGYKFRRQEPIGDYIVDFVCYRPRVVVEVDGAQHVENHADQVRDRWFEAQGFKVIRAWNTDVLNSLEGVLDAIAAAIVAQSGQQPPGRGKSERRYDLGDNS